MIFSKQGCRSQTAIKIEMPNILGGNDVPIAIFIFIIVGIWILISIQIV